MKQYSLKIKYDERFSYDWGYALYSAFLDEIGKAQGEAIHRDIIFNQFVTPYRWVINTKERLTLEKEYFLTKFNAKVEIIEKDMTEIGEQEMADRYLINDEARRKIRINFLTPTTFKQDGAHVLYPTKDLIMQSLTNKWNQWAEKFSLEELNWANCRISRYNLKSSAFRIKGVYIQGFMGHVVISFWGSESIIRLGNLVLNFAPYCGLGVKTKLGMGGISVE